MIIAVLSWSRYKLRDKHDAMIEEPRKLDNPSGSAGAYFPGGKYIYEKEFFIEKDFRDKYVAFEFEGVYKNAKVYI